MCHNQGRGSLQNQKSWNIRYPPDVRSLTIFVTSMIVAFWRVNCSNGTESGVITSSQLYTCEKRPSLKIVYIKSFLDCEFASFTSAKMWCILCWERRFLAPAKTFASYPSVSILMRRTSSSTTLSSMVTSTVSRSPLLRNPLCIPMSVILSACSASLASVITTPESLRLFLSKPLRAQVSVCLYIACVSARPTPFGYNLSWSKLLIALERLRYRNATELGSKEATRQPYDAAIREKYPTCAPTSSTRALPSLHPCFFKTWWNICDSTGDQYPKSLTLSQISQKQLLQTNIKKGCAIESITSTKCTVGLPTCPCFMATLSRLLNLQVHTPLSVWSCKNYNFK